MLRWTKKDNNMDKGLGYYVNLHNGERQVLYDLIHMYKATKQKMKTQSKNELGS